MGSTVNNFNIEPDSPANHAEAVVPNETTDLPNQARALYVGTTGDINLVTTGGDIILFVGVLAGSILPVQVSRVLVSSTTALNIVALR